LIVPLRRIEHVLPKLVTALAAAWAAVALDVVAESALTDGPSIRAFGRTVAEPAAGTASLVLILAGISLGAIAALGIAALVESFRAKALRAEIERRAEARSLEHVGLLAKNDLLTWRINELQEQADELLAKRDGLLDELGVLTSKTQQLRAEARHSKELLAQLSEQLVVMPEMLPTASDPSELDR
jgi:hypothetical protein